MNNVFRGDSIPQEDKRHECLGSLSVIIAREAPDHSFCMFLKEALCRRSQQIFVFCHGGNSDDPVSIPAMTGTVAVNICVYFNGLWKKKKISDIDGRERSGR